MLDFILYRLFNTPLPMRVRYDRHPKNPKATILFIHGIASSYLAWREVYPKLTQDKSLKNIRLVAIDLIGFGKSPKPKWYKYNYRNYDRSLHRTIKKLKVKGPLILAGHSMGCLVSANYAAEHPGKITSLILVSPPFLRPSDIAKVPDKFYQNAYHSFNTHRDNQFVVAIAAFISKVSSFDHHTLKTPAFQETMDNIILNNNNWHMAQKLNLPIHIIHGHLDPLVFGGNLRSLARSNKNIKLTESIGGHDIIPPKLSKVIKVIKNSTEPFLQKS